MRAVWIEPDERYLGERRRLGLDGKDEVWDGVLHMVPTPSGPHETMACELMFALKPHADRLGLIVRGGQSGLYEREDNYRVPDVMLAKREHMSARGLEGAELVIEVLSPNDESRDKMPFYAARGVRELWLVHPIKRTVELFALSDGAYEPIEDDRSIVLGIAVSPLISSIE